MSRDDLASQIMDFCSRQELVNVHLPSGWIDGRAYDSLWQLSDCRSTGAGLEMIFDESLRLEVEGQLQLCEQSASPQYSSFPCLSIRGVSRWSLTPDLEAGDTTHHHGLDEIVALIGERPR